MPELRVIEAEPAGADIVERLEAVLTRARNGELSSIGIALVYRDGSIEALWSTAPSRGLLLGAVTRLAYRINQALDV